MRGYGLAVGAILALGVLLPLSAAAQDWSVSVDGQVQAQLSAKPPSGKAVVKTLKSQDGFQIGIGTPYHIGITAAHFGGSVDDIGNSTPATLKTDVVGVNFNFSPWPKTMTLALGMGVGSGKFDPSSIVSGGSSYKLEPINFWQYSALFGLRIISGLELRVGYQRLDGELTIRDRTQSPVYVVSEDVHLGITTAGLAWHF